MELNSYELLEIGLSQTQLIALALISFGRNKKHPQHGLGTPRVRN